jgi:GNAT superfamily N-acetyltransferase
MAILDDGGILLGAAPSISSSQFNRGLGLAEHPGRVGEAVAFFEDHGVVGEIALDPAEVPRGVEGRLRLDVYLGDSTAVESVAVDGFETRIMAADEAGAWFEAGIEVFAPAPEVATLWRAMAPHVGRTPDWLLLAGEMDGRLVATSSLFMADGVGWLSWAMVIPRARGLGIQRAMIAARARLAADRGCEQLAAWALAGAHSSDNLARAGLERIGQRVVVRVADLG